MHEYRILSGSGRAYVVQKGDCLWLIGHRLGIDWTRIARLNNISQPWTIYPKQMLLLP